jgi:hypothetical protein
VSLNTKKEIRYTYKNTQKKKCNEYAYFGSSFKMNIHTHKVLYTNNLLIIYNVKYEKTVKTKIWLNAYPTITHINIQNFQCIQPTHFVDFKINVNIDQ